MQMDKMTQQNAALVEQAAAASRSMADQASELSAMMDKYRVQDSDVSPSAEPQRPVERRATTRPWGEKPKSARAAMAPAKPAARREASKVANADWSEF